MIPYENDRESMFSLVSYVSSYMYFDWACKGDPTQSLEAVTQMGSKKVRRQEVAAGPESRLR